MAAPVPVVLLGLDPLFWAQVKLFVADVHTLTAHPDAAGACAAAVDRARSLNPAGALAEVYCYGTHPLRRVSVLGQVVALVRREKKLELVGMPAARAPRRRRRLMGAARARQWTTGQACSGARSGSARTPSGARGHCPSWARSSTLRAA
jgi:hypothetical protein